MNLLTLSFSVLIGTFCSVSLLFSGNMPDSLRQKLTMLHKGEKLPVIVRFAERPHLARFKQGNASAPAMIQYLRTLSTESIRQLRTTLDRFHYTGRIVPLWISNSVLLDVTQTIADSIAALPYVSGFTEDEQIVLYAEQTPSIAPFGVSSNSNAGWNVKIIKADSVWHQYGLNGCGIIIGSMDTGVDTSHPSLFNKWILGPRRWYDAISNKKTPYDDDGHGTHTTGTLVGGDGPGPDTNDVGIAYGSRFIAAKMLTSGFASIAQVTGAAQWMIDPDNNPTTSDFPRVVNNSWFSNTRGSTWFADAAAAWRAAGIIPVFCAANFGPGGSSTRSPGDYGICISVGATNSNDNIYLSSSVGPSATGSVFPSDGRKPDFSAPGDGIRSCSRGGGFHYSSGTSMATPHVTGTIALMLQANSTLTYDEVVTILKQTSVDRGSAGYDYSFGYGRINALAAVRQALAMRLSITPITGLQTSETGDSVQLALSLRVAPVAPIQVYLTLSDTTEGILLSDSIITFTPEDWDFVRTVTIQGKGDGITDGNVTYSLQAHVRAQDSLYNNISVQSAHITNNDATALSSPDLPEVEPALFTVAENYPNPFNPTTNFRIFLASAGYLTLKIYNTLGREISTVTEGFTSPGEHRFQWDAGNNPSGVYFYRLSVAGERTQRMYATSGKMMLIR